MYNSKLENYVTLQNEPKIASTHTSFMSFGETKRRNQIVEKMIGCEVKHGRQSMNKNLTDMILIYINRINGDRVILLPIHNCLSLKEAEFYYFFRNHLGSIK